MLQPLQDPTKRFFDQTVTESSYIISKEAGKFYGKNGKTGQVEFCDIDFSEVFQPAVNALPAEGGRIVLLPMGTVEVSKKISFARSVVEIVAPARGVILKAKDGLNDHILEVGDGTSWYYHIVLEGLLFNGNKLNQTVTTIDCVDFKKISDFDIKYCYFEYAKRAGFMGLNVNFGTFLACGFRNNDGSGMDITSTDPSQRGWCRGNEIINCRSENNSGDGFVLGTGEHNSLTHPYARANGGFGIAFDSVIQSKVIGAECVENLHGIGVFTAITQDASDNEILCGSCRLNKRHGLYAYTTYANRGKIIGLYCLDNSQETHNTYDDIRLEDVVDWIVNVDARATAVNKTAYGVREIGTANRNQLVMCKFIGQASGRISLVGADSRELIPDVWRPLSETDILLIRGAGGAITGNAGTTYAALDYSYNYWRWADWRNIRKVVWESDWNPQTTAGGLQLWNSTDNVEIAKSEPAAAGWRNDVIDVSAAFKGYTADKLILVRTKGDGATAPLIGFSKLRVVVEV